VAPSSSQRNATANGIVSRAVRSTCNAARQVSDVRPASAIDNPPSSRTTRIRRSYSTLAVVSVDTVNMPAVLPSTSTIGLCE
jgi:hypothetical protein